ncbi:TPA: VapE domain-containing protein [Burkholderia cenocepacia]
MNNHKINESARVIPIDQSFDFDDFDAAAWEAKHGRPHAGTTLLKKIVNDIKTKAQTGYLPLDSKIVNPQWPDKSGENGAPINTWQNLQWMLNQYGVKARYNVVSKDVDVTLPGIDFGPDASANCVLTELSTICARNKMPKSELAEQIKLIGVRNQFNPAQEFIESKPWDGVSRLPELYATLKTAPGSDRSNMELLVRRWLISAVAAALKPTGFWSKGVLVLQGPQSLGKTAWIKSLFPEEQRGLVKIGASLDPSNKDSVSSAIGHWIVELGELDGTFRKADIAKLKAFISQDVDMLRRPYDRLESRYQRRTVFFASVNPEKFLADETGNVRWWTIAVTDVNYQHSIDVQQLWAEVATLLDAGERWWLERDEEKKLAEINAEHENVDPLEELILSRFDWNVAGAARAMTATEVLIEVGMTPSKALSTQCSVILKKLTGKDARKSNGRKVFALPPTRGDSGF